MHTIDTDSYINGFNFFDMQLHYPEIELWVIQIQVYILLVVLVAAKFYFMIFQYCYNMH